MSVATKIMVVLATVLSLVAMALIAVNVTNSDALRGKFELAESRRQEAEAAAKSAQADLTTAKQEQTAELTRKAEEIDRLTGQMADLQARRAELETQVAQANAAGQDVRAQLARLSATMETFSKVIALRDEESRQLRDLTAKLREENVGLNQGLQERIAQLDTLQRQVRMIQEQAASQQPAEGGQAVASANAVGAAAPAAALKNGQVVRGSITEVRKVGDETFVALNIGKNDQVTPGMSVLIHKGNEYLGTATVTKVDANSAAARVTLSKGAIAPNAEVQIGGF